LLSTGNHNFHRKEDTLKSPAARVKRVRVCVHVRVCMSHTHTRQLAGLSWPASTNSFVDAVRVPNSFVDAVRVAGLSGHIIETCVCVCVCPFMYDLHTAAVCVYIHIHSYTFI
jgi:hypothetical protein